MAGILLALGILETPLPPLFQVLPKRNMRPNGRNVTSI